MKIKEGFITREMGGEYVGLYVGEEKDPIGGMIRMNEVTAFLWDCLQEEYSRQELLEKMLARYDVPESVAAKDLDEILAQMKKENILE